MSRNTGTFNFAANFEGLLKGPSDAKQLVITYSALTSPSSWNQSGSVWLYNGAVVSVADDIDPTKNTLYYLKDADNYTMTCSWTKIGSGSGTLTGATNGLHLTDSDTTVALGGNLTGNTTFSGGILKYGGDYSSGYDVRSLVDKGYVDSVATGLDPKLAAEVATTTNIVLSGNPTIDGISVQNGWRVLVKNQISGSMNGIYIVTGGTWSRSTDFDYTPSGEIVQGVLIPVITGNTNRNTIWVLVTPDPIVSGTTLTFTLFSSPIVNAGVGIIVSGMTISVDGASLEGNSISWTGNTFNVNPGIGTLNTVLNTKLNTVVFTGYTASTQQILNTSITGATNGLTKTGQLVELGGVLTGNTALTGAYTLSVCGGAKINTTCGYQISGTTILRAGDSTITSIYIGQNVGLISTGVNNVGIGCNALYSNTTGHNNIANGARALYSNISGTYNIASGFQSLNSNTTGSYNIANGCRALYSNLGGCHNIANGGTALYGNLSGSYNIANGNSALNGNVSGCYNTAIGYSALYSNTLGCSNLGIGLSTLGSNTSGCKNIAIGEGSLFSIVSGCNNIGIGICTGPEVFCNQTGNTNIFIGYYAGYNERGSNKLYIANNSACNLIYGDFANNFVTLPTVKICNTPVTGINTDSLLVWNSVDKCVKVINGGAVLSSAITGATNGLTKTGQVVVLGGTLTGNTTFNGTGSNYHLKYSADYSSAYSARSVPDVAYVTGYTKSMSNIVAVREIILSNQGTCSEDEFIGAYNCNLITGFTINLDNTPIYGQKVTIVDTIGNALSYPIIVYGQSYSINGCACAVINTDYGSISFVFNCRNHWSAVSFIN